MIIDKKIKIDEAVIHYSVVGDKAKQTLVFLHGWPGDVALKKIVMAELANDFYVIAPEQPGLARSEPLPEYTNIFEQYADVVFQILRQENLGEQAHVIMGQSFGGSVASAFAEKYKVNTCALILVDSIMGGQKQDIFRKIILRLGKQIITAYLYLPNFLKKHGLKKAFGWEEFGRNRHHNNILIKKRVAMVANYCNLAYRAFKQKYNLLDRDYDNDIPIIMLWGDRDGKERNLDGYSRAEDAEKLYKKMKAAGKKAEFLVVKGGHTILYEKPKEIIAEIKKGLDKYINIT